MGTCWGEMPGGVGRAVAVSAVVSHRERLRTVFRSPYQDGFSGAGFEGVEVAVDGGVGAGGGEDGGRGGEAGFDGVDPVAAGLPGEEVLLMEGFGALPLAEQVEPEGGVGGGQGGFAVAPGGTGGGRRGEEGHEVVGVGGDDGPEGRGGVQQEALHVGGQRGGQVAGDGQGAVFDEIGGVEGFGEVGGDVGSPVAGVEGEGAEEGGFDGEVSGVAGVVGVVAGEGGPGAEVQVPEGFGIGGVEEGRQGLEVGEVDGVAGGEGAEEGGPGGGGGGGEEEVDGGGGVGFFAPRAGRHFVEAEDVGEGQGGGGG